MLYKIMEESFLANVLDNSCRHIICSNDLDSIYNHIDIHLIMEKLFSKEDLPMLLQNLTVICSCQTELVCP
jgi:hypothetical protein